jgi:hypothetical protein
MEDHGYVLLQIDFWAAWFVRRDLADAPLGWGYQSIYYDALSWYVAGYATIDYRSSFIETTA